MIRTVLLAIAVIGMTTSANAGHCSLSKASGLGVSKELATTYSKQALGELIATNGEKARGRVVTKCTTDGITFTCISKVRSCKK